MDINSSTKQRLLMLINDMELISKELIQNMIVPKEKKMSTTDHAAHIDLLIHKDVEFKQMLRQASEQAKIENKMIELQPKLEVYNREILKLQKSLMEAGQILSTAIFELNQSLNITRQANQHPVASEELIKYAQLISSANSVSAPSTWSVGDVRRPYPTDIEMRSGFLGKADLSISESAVHQSNQPAQSNPDVPSGSQNQFNWNNLGELHMSMGPSGSGTVSLKTQANKEPSQGAEVEVMSTDSSSSSSSDSQ